MKSAITLARRGMGRCAPNPSVGCVIVKDSHVIGRSVTAPGGRPHAETQALGQAGSEAKGADVYVTLEPCAHIGETPSCADELIKVGVKRVVIACADPDPRTNGQGIEKLRSAGVEVVTDVLKEEALETLRGFILSKTQNRPEITLKTACSLDGKIALGNGTSKWITGELARRYAHLERAQHDAIACGIGTIIADDPYLTTRLPGIKSGAPRIVFDTNLRLSTSAKVLEAIKDQPVWVVCSEGANKKTQKSLQDLGVTLLKVKDLKDALFQMSEAGVTRLLVEGGPTLMTSFLNQNFWDRWLVFRAPKLMGADGRSLSGDLNLEDMAQVLSLTPSETRQLGEDRLEIYENPA